MLGQAQVDYDRLLMQLDGETGQYEQLPPATLGFKRPTLNYRKIEFLEYDPLFLAYSYIDARTRSLSSNQTFSVIYGKNALAAAKTAVEQNGL